MNPDNFYVHQECYFCKLPRLPENVVAVRYESAVHESCLQEDRRSRKAKAMYQAAMLRGAAAMLESSEVEISEEIVSAALRASMPKPRAAPSNRGAT